MALVLPPEAVDGLDVAMCRVLHDRDGRHWRSLRDDARRVDEDTSTRPEDDSARPPALTERSPH